jgi:hypothetical protein
MTESKGMILFILVIPANLGNPNLLSAELVWIPAFAGMTDFNPVGQPLASRACIFEGGPHSSQ